MRSFFTTDTFLNKSSFKLHHLIRSLILYKFHFTFPHSNEFGKSILSNLQPSKLIGIETTSPSFAYNSHNEYTFQRILLRISPLDSKLNYLQNSWHISPSKIVRTSKIHRSSICKPDQQRKISTFCLLSFLITNTFLNEFSFELNHLIQSSILYEIHLIFPHSNEFGKTIFSNLRPTKHRQRENFVFFCAYNSHNEYIFQRIFLKIPPLASKLNSLQKSMT